MKKNKKRVKMLKPNELAYLLLVSSVITGCTQEVQRLPNYQEALEHCKNTPEYCQEADKLNQVVGSNGASASFDPATNTHTVYHNNNNSFLNYYLMYHLFFARSSNVNSSMYQNRFTNYNATNFKDKEDQYRGRGVYTPAYVSRMSSEIASGKTSYVSAEGKVFKSAQFAGSSKSSITGKAISRGGFGSMGRSMGVSS